jgi:hypothetical protein
MDALTMNESGFNPFLFNSHKECIICMEKFTEGQKVTALPCDERHYFHSECILSWSERHRNCPLCKKPYDVTSIKRFNKKFVKLAEKAEDERRSSMVSSSSRTSISLKTIYDEEHSNLDYQSIDEEEAERELFISPETKSLDKSDIESASSSVSSRSSSISSQEESSRRKQRYTTIN